MFVRRILLIRNLAFNMTACAAIASYAFAADDNDQLDPAGQILPTSQRITPIATPDAVLYELRPGLPEAPSYTAGGAMSTVISPDGKTLLVLTSGYNRLNGQNGKQLSCASNEYVFVFDVEYGKPAQKQVIQVPNTFAGIAFAQDGQSFYVSGGKDDNVHVFTISNDGSWAESGSPIMLGHKAGNGPNVSPIAAGLATLRRLTNRVALNNLFFRGSNSRDQSVMSQLRHRIRHIIYIIKENRSYDQILGDLDRGNGDPILVEFGRAVTPNLHRMARKFVDLDNFYDTADVSADGWPWSTSGRQTDWVSKTVPMNYAGRGSTYDYEGENRNVDLALPTLEKRQVDDPSLKDPDLLPGSANVAAPDGPAGTPEGTGYLWDAVLRAGLTLRNYGCFGVSAKTKLEPYPFKANVKLFIPTSPALLEHTDCYYLGFDTRYPDFYREKEWEREFDQFVRSRRLPSFEIVRLPQDHTDPKVKGIGGVIGPEMQVADNDYAVGRIVEKVARSRYKSNTLIFVLEDDAQSGEDHVDAHRSTAYVVGPYVKHGAVVSVRYTTINLIRTIEDILGLDHLNINTATQRPMSDCFDLHQLDWTFSAKPSACLAATQLPIPPSGDQAYHFAHDAGCWAAKAAEFDFSVADNLSDPGKYNRIIWEGLKGNIPYPTSRDGRDLRKNRLTLLRNAGLENNQPKTNR